MSDLSEYFQNEVKPYMYVVGEADEIDEEELKDRGCVGVMSFEEVVSKVREKIGDDIVVLKQEESDGNIRHYISINGEVSLSTALYDMLDSTAVKEHPSFNERDLEMYTSYGEPTSTIYFLDNTNYKIYD